MTVALASVDIEGFRALVARRLGLYFEDAKLDFLADVLQRRMEGTRCDLFSSYQRRIASSANEHEELCALAEQLTVNETYFFRYGDHFRAFAEVVVPNRIEARVHQRRLRILSAGCASGEEAYSLAILIRDRFPELASWDISIHGIDVNPSMVGKALRARYTTWSLRETPADLQRKYFRPDGRDFLLDGTLKPGVTFEERNLVEEDPLFWQGDAFDVVFCRNVTMYFTIETTQSVISRIARSLAPGGFLFLGHAETLRGVSHEFHLRHTHETFYYQRRETLETARVADLPQPRGDHGAFQRPIPAAAEPGDSWFNTIRQASERIANLTQDKSAPAIGGSGRPSSHSSKSKAAPTPPLWDRTLAIELLRKERFREAMELLRALPLESNADPDTQLL